MLEGGYLAVGAVGAQPKAVAAGAELPAAQHAFEVFHSPRTSYVIQAVDAFLAAVYSQYLGTR